MFGVTILLIAARSTARMNEGYLSWLVAGWFIFLTDKLLHFGKTIELALLDDLAQLLFLGTTTGVVDETIHHDNPRNRYRIRCHQILVALEEQNKVMHGAVPLTAKPS